MTKEQALKRLRELKHAGEHGGDIETIHSDADEIIVSFCPVPIREAYDAVRKWYS